MKHHTTSHGFRPNGIMSPLKLLLKSLTFAIVLSLATLAARAQITNVTNDQSTPIAGAGHDYIHMLNETVNPANGSVSLRLHAPMPAGRRLSIPFAFAYDSNGVHHLTSDGSGGSFWVSNSSFLSQGGWAYSAPLLSFASLSVPYPNGGGSCGFTTEFVFEDPAGGRHALGLSSTDNQTGNPCGLYPTTLAGDDLFTASTIDGNAINPPTRVADANGTVFYFSNSNSHGVIASPISVSLPNYIEDRNGNKIIVADFMTPTGANRGVFNYTDTLSRTVLSSSGFGASGNTVSISGLSGLYTMSWGTASASYPVSSVYLNPPGSCRAPTNVSESQSVISTISLPNGRSYQYYYDSSYGLLNKVVYPNGGYVRYVWTINSLSEGGEYSDGGQGFCDDRYDTPAILHRYVSFDGTNEVLQQDFSYSTTWLSNTTSWTSKQTTVTTSDLIRTGSFQTVYTYSPSGCGGPAAPNVQDHFAAQCPVEQTVTYKNWDGSTLRTVNKSWADVNMLLSEQGTQNGQTSKTTYSYANNNTTALVTEKDEYDFGSPAPLIKKTVTNYASFPVTPIFPAGPSILDRPSSIIIYDGSGSRIAETDYGYDQTSVASVSPSPTGHDETNYAATYTNRGNATTVTLKCLQSCTDAVTKYTYDETGQALTMVDPCGNATCSDMSGSNHTTTYSYADSYTTLSGGQNVSYTPSGNTNALLTKITDPLGHIKNFTYDFNNGQLTVSKDQNSQSTTYVYNDSMARPTQVSYPDGGQTTLSYNDATYNPATPSPSVTTTRAMTSTSNVTSLAAFDGLGHRVLNTLCEDGSACTKPIMTNTVFDGLGRVWTQSNPHRTTSSSSDGTTTNYYDALGRTCLVVPPDGTLPTGNACPAAQPANDLFTTYSGNCTTVTDQAGKSRKSCSDGLGRLTQVFEDPAALNYETDYGYDALDNLLCVGQKGTNTGTFSGCPSIPAAWRPRTFAYDSLSRLTSATNPESGTISYTYDANGNVATKVAPAPNQTGSATVTTTYSYDALNRLSLKTYSDTTTSASFRYDFAQPSNPYIQFTSNNPIGRLVSTTTSGQCAFFSYDSLGRVVVSQQSSSSLNCFRGVGFPSPFTYTYNFLGRETTESNPAGFTITYGYDAAGRVSQITSSLSDSQHPATLASLDPTLGYFPNGAIRKITYGNGLSDTFAYNSRLQPCRLNLNSSGSALSTCADAIPAGSVQDFTYGFNLGTANNGNVASWSATGAQTFGRTYAYDSLNRLLTMSDSATAQACKGLSWTNDPWGNRTDQTVTAGTCNTFHQAVDANNRLLGAPYQYDAAGNLVADGNQTYTYDAENRVTNVDGGTTASYNYDAEGHRWRKVIGSVTTRYLYNLSEQVGAELSSAWGPAYVYLGGQLLAEYQNSTTYFVHKDHLGSTRLLTAMDKSVCDSLDYLPYGEQIAGGSCTTHKFTGKERDPESGLDNFGARYNSSSMGRFMSPDQLGAGQHPGDPQSWNLYSYVQNNPLNLVDPTGQFTCDTKTVSQQECDNFQAGLDRAQDAADALGQKYGWDSKQYLDAQRAIDAYGDEDVDNGVVIAQGDTKGFGGNTRVAGTTVAKTDDNPTGQNIRVTLNSDKHYLSGDKNDLLALVASHEGSHVADGSDWVASGFRNNANPSREQTELDAYRVTANIGEGLGFHSLSFSFGDGKRFLTWVNGWPDQMTNFAVAVMLKNEYPRLQLDAFSRNTKVGR